MPKLALHWKIVIALVLGALVGVGINRYWTSQTWQSLGVADSAAYLKHQTSDANAGAGTVAAAARFLRQAAQFTGDLFLRLLRFIAVPIVLFSLIVGVANLGDIRKIGRIGGKTIALFLFTGLTSAALGVFLASELKPGVGLPPDVQSRLLSTSSTGTSAGSETVKQATGVAKDTSAWKFLIDAFPANPFKAIAEAQMLQIVTTGILIGLALTMIPTDKSRPVIAFCEGLSEAVLKLVTVIMHAAPLAVFALSAGIVASFGLDIFKQLASYCLVVILGLSLILFVLYPGLTTLLTPSGNRVGWGRFFRAIAPAQLVAFSSSSSAVTLPVTLQCARDRLGADEDVASFNMDGTALYQAIAVTFLAQLYGVDMTFADRMSVTLLAALLSVGVPGIPGGSLAIMIVVLESIGVPPDAVLIILAVDRLLDMCRTVVNVSGDAMGTAIIASSEGKLRKPGELRVPAA
jgi:proton glutamate symport protein